MALRFAFVAPLVATVAYAEPDAVAGHDAAWWRAASEARAADVETRHAELAACEEREAPPAYDAVDGYVTTGRRDGRLRYVKIRRCDEERAAFEAARAELDRFEEQARGSGVPPGWLR